MCQTCKSIENNLEKARREGNQEKERVMKLLLDNHCKLSHPPIHNVVAVDPEVVIWPDGTRWEVR